METHKEFTFKSDCRCILSSLRTLLENEVLVSLAGYLSHQEGYETKVTITLQGFVNVKMACGDRVSTSVGVTLGEVYNLPGWEEQAALKTPGFIYVDCEAVIKNIEGEDITLALPEYYNSSYRPIYETEILATLTKKVSEKEAMAAVLIRKRMIELIGLDFESHLAYPIDVFDFENKCFNMEALKELDEVDLNGLTQTINDYYFNSIGRMEGKYGGFYAEEVWADWSLYGYDSICDVPLDDDKFLLSVIFDSAYCLVLFKSNVDLESFLTLEKISERCEESAALKPRLQKINDRKLQGKRP